MSAASGSQSGRAQQPTQSQVAQQQQYPPSHQQYPQQHPVGQYPPQQHNSQGQHPQQSYAPAPYPSQQQYPGQYPPRQQYPGQYPPQQQYPGQYPPQQQYPGQYPSQQQYPGQYPPQQQYPGQHPPGQQYPPGQYDPQQQQYYPPGTEPPADGEAAAAVPPSVPVPLGIVGQFSSGLFGCFSDCRVLFCGVCCLSCLYGDNRQRVHGPEAFWRSCLCYFWLPCCRCWIADKTRRDIRIKYDLNEGPCSDCCVHFWCTQCAVCQEARELRLQGTRQGIAHPAPAAAAATPEGGGTAANTEGLPQGDVTPAAAAGETPDGVAVPAPLQPPLAQEVSRQGGVPASVDGSQRSGLGGPGRRV